MPELSHGARHCSGHFPSNFPNPQPKTSDMSNQLSVSSRVLALLLPAIFGLSCVERDWNFCSYEDKCRTGYRCTDDWKCVLDVDGGADGLVAADGNRTTDQAIGTDSPAAPDAGSAIGRDAAGPDAVSSTPDAALSTGPDGPEPDAARLIASPDAPVDTRTDSPVDAAPDAPVDADAPAPDTLAPSVPDAPAPGGPVDARSTDAPPTGPTVDAAGTCSTDRDCSPQSLLCLGNRCARCGVDNDCTGRTGTPACNITSGLCVACTANKHCTGAAGTCDTATNQCVGCVTRSDCAGACLTCSSGGVCTAVKNQDDPGVCSGTCDSTGACKSKQGQSCQTVAAGCAAGTTCSPDGVCCNSTCDQACHSCLGSKTGGVDGTCANETNGTVCGTGQYCNAGTCGGGCLIGGTLYASGAVSSTNSCQTCQPSVSPTSWSPLGNGVGCGSGQICSGGNCQTGCWIGGSLVGSGATNSTNICQVCIPTKSTSAWVNNDSATAIPCGSCGGTATCSNMALGSCSKDVASYYVDADGDGYGNPALQTVSACSAPASYTKTCCDCDDSDRTIYPGTARCDPYGDVNALTTCSNSGSFVSTTCANGCAGAECRTFTTVSNPNYVTCGNLQCPTSQGCSFPSAWATSAPVCGTNTANYNAACDGPNDCAADQVCCHSYSGGDRQGSTTCVANDGSCPRSEMGYVYEVVCDPSQPVCAVGTTCQMLPSGIIFSAYVCR